MSWHACFVVRGRALGVHQCGATQVTALWHCIWERGLKGNSAICFTLCWFSVTYPATHNQLGPFWCWLQGGWVCVHCRTLWVSPMNSPVRLGVSPDSSTPTGVFSQRLWGFIFWYWNTGLHGQYCSPFVPSSLSSCECWTAQSASRCLAPSASCHLAHPVLQLLPCHESSPPSCPSPPLLLVWMNVSSLTPWLSDFHTVQFSVSAGCFLFLNLLFFFWLCEEAQCVYLPASLFLQWSSSFSNWYQI